MASEPMPECREILAAETRPLRQVVLRAHQPDADLNYPGDDAPDSVHFGVFLGEELVSVASLYQQDQNGDSDGLSWRIRGMATLSEFQSQGLGGVALQACISHAQENEGTCIWCNARVSALKFYQKHGFEVQGEEFEIEGIGPHYIAYLKLK